MIRVMFYLLIFNHGVGHLPKSRSRFVALFVAITGQTLMFILVFPYLWDAGGNLDGKKDIPVILPIETGRPDDKRVTIQHVEVREKKASCGDQLLEAIIQLPVSSTLLCRYSRDVEDHICYDRQVRP